MEPSILSQFHVKKGSVTCCCFSEDLHFAVGGTSSGAVFLFPLDESAQFQKYTGHIDAVTSIASSGPIIISGSADSTVRIWSGKESHVLRPNDGAIHAIAIARNKPFVIIAGEDSTPSVWNYEREELVILLPQHPSVINTVAISNDGETCITGSLDGIIRVFSTKTQKIEFQIKNSDPITCLSINPRQRFIVAGTTEGEILMIDLHSREVIAESQLSDSKITSLAFHPELPIILIGCANKTVQIVDQHSLSPIFTLTGHKDAVNGVCWHSEGDKFISSSDDNSCSVWQYPIPEENEEDDDSEVYVETNPQVQIKRNDGSTSEEMSKMNITQGNEEEEEKKEQKIDPKMEMMNKIFELIQNLSSTIGDMEKRVDQLDQKIELIQRVQAETQATVTRTTRK